LTQIAWLAIVTTITKLCSSKNVCVACKSASDCLGKLGCDSAGACASCTSDQDCKDAFLGNPLTYRCQ